jgi:hypothetical protein
MVWAIVTWLVIGVGLNLSGVLILSHFGIHLGWWAFAYGGAFGLAGTIAAWHVHKRFG